MPSYDVAHIREQGQNMLLFPLSSSFGSRSDHEQNATLSELQMRARAAGLAGGAVAFWESGGRTNFRGPRPWHPFLRGLSMHAVMRSVNKKISW